MAYEITQHEKNRLREKVLKRWRKRVGEFSWRRPEITQKHAKTRQPYVVPPEDPEIIKHLFLTGGWIEPFMNQPMSENLAPEQPVVPLIKGYEPPMYDFEKKIYIFPRYDSERKNHSRKYRISKAIEARDNIILAAEEEILAEEEMLRIKTLKALFGENLEGYRRPIEKKKEHGVGKTIFLIECCWWFLSCCFFER